MTKANSGGRGGIGAKVSSQTSDFDKLSKAMVKANPRSSRGAPVLISELRSKMPSWKGDNFDKKIVQLERDGKIGMVLHSQALAPVPRSQLVSDGQRLYNSVFFKR
jgi:hypothetical protein